MIPSLSLVSEFGPLLCTSFSVSVSFLSLFFPFFVVVSLLEHITWFPSEGRFKPQFTRSFKNRMYPVNTVHTAPTLPHRFRKSSSSSFCSLCEHGWYTTIIQTQYVNYTNPVCYHKSWNQGCTWYNKQRTPFWLAQLHPFISLVWPM